MVTFIQGEFFCLQRATAKCPPPKDGHEGRVGRPKGAPIDRVPPHRMGARIRKFWTKTSILGGGYSVSSAIPWCAVLVARYSIQEGFAQIYALARTIFNALDTLSQQTHLTAPPYFAEGEKYFGFFSCKRHFFPIEKKGKGLTTAPPYFREKCSEGGGQLGGFVVIGQGSDIHFRAGGRFSAAAVQFFAPASRKA